MKLCDGIKMTRKTSCKEISFIVFSCLVIILLVTFIYFLWSPFGSTTTIEANVNKRKEISYGPRIEFSEKEELRKLQDRVREKNTKVNIDEILNNNRYDSEQITPIKIKPNGVLNEHDILHGNDKLWNISGEKVVLKNINSTGHFRHIKTPIWDPHPQYEFSAFGKKFRLELKLDTTEYHSPKLRVHAVTKLSENSSIVIPKEVHRNSKLCRYTGRVMGDIKSTVHVNLCHGMTGVIKTNDDYYIIEPTITWSANESSDPLNIPPIPHIIYKQKLHSTHDAEIDYEREANTANSMEEDARIQLNEQHSTEILESAAGEIIEQNTWNNELHTNTLHRRKRSLVEMGSFSKQLYIAVKVVVDRKMLEYHGDGLEVYVLNLLSTVSHVFKDATVGNHINIQLVDIESRPDKSFYSHDFHKKYPNVSDVWATDVLRTFCDWQFHHRHTYDNSRTYDTAILITRENLCRYSNLTSCGTLGLAEVGSICNPRKSCSIVQDNGLSAAFTIAHELGHVLNMKHDNDAKCRRYMNNTEKHFMMAHMPGMHTYPWAWSNCSRHFLTEFLEEGHGRCLENKHQISGGYEEKHKSSMLPGENFNPNKQCALVYGNGSKICAYMPQCSNLWCSRDHVGKEGCISQFIPWADGTPCRHGHWCHRGRCVRVNREVLKPVHGGWSNWGGWGACSRSCGGGIRQARRECNSPSPENGGQYCVGERVKYESCHTQDCRNDVIDFRDTQCSQVHESTHDRKWIAKYFTSRADLCKLYCRSPYSDAYFLFAEKVLDGTSCSPDSNDICVNGKCYPAGCDHVLGSTTKLDSCGVCDGDETWCEVVRGKYNISAPEYQKVVVFPAGSTNIYVQQVSLNSNNKNNGLGDDIHLALRLNDTGKYILNGGYNVRPYHSRIFEAGAAISYSGAKAELEILNSTLDPIKVAVALEVFIVGKPVAPNIEYSYTLQYQYVWKAITDWSDCNNNCHSNRQLSCIDRFNHVTVPKSFCTSNRKKPDWLKICHSSKCSVRSVKCFNEHDKHRKYCQKFKLIAGDWSHCNASCNSHGYQIRSVKCVNTKHRDVSFNYCESIRSEDITKPCYRQCKAEWQTGDWTPCSNSCGNGIRKRPLWCELEGRKVTEHICDNLFENRPGTQESCHSDAGCTSEWRIGPTSPCSVSCGVGKTSRRVTCVLGDKVKNDNYCAHTVKPDEVMNCVLPTCSHFPDTLHSVPEHSPDTNNQRTPNIDNNSLPRVLHRQYVWDLDIWSPCSASCGTGVKTRYVQCLDIERNIAVHDDYCSSWEKKPEVVIECSLQCGIWRHSEWNPCNALCGRGIQTRDVTCESEDGREKLNEISCPNNVRPADTQQCEGHSCSWSTGPWGECMFNYARPCGLGQKRRQVKCLHNECEGTKPNDTEICKIVCPESIWNYGMWGACTRPCGGGSKFRLTICMFQNGTLLEEEACDPKQKPPSTQTCNEHSCNGYKWKVGSWGECSVQCGRGLKFRSVECVTSVSSPGQVVDGFYCNLIEPPTNNRTCQKYKCPYSWQTSPWSECSVACGVGVQKRNVTCHKISRGWPERTMISHQYCKNLNKPLDMQRCEKETCSDRYRWATTSWSQCIPSCGRHSKRKRTVYCIEQNGRRVKPNLCRKERKPTRKQDCTVFNCLSPVNCKDVRSLMRSARDGEYLINVYGKNISIYCHSMVSREPQEFLSLPTGESENYSEFYHLSLKDPNTCPFNGEQRHDCPCVPESRGLSGTTVFTKIRINLKTLKVLTNDFTFARNIRGNRNITYGEAGDCYSNKECPQGRFSINLTGTPFFVSQRTGWHSSGYMKHLSSENRQKFWGTCGGMCHSCAPSKSSGLKLALLDNIRHR